METVEDFHAQDWIIITEALLMWSWPPHETSIERVDRAGELVDAVANTYELPPEELIEQTDHTWSGTQQ